MKVPFIKNIDVLKFVCSTDFIDFREYTAFEDRHIDYMLTTVPDNSQPDIATGIALKSHSSPLNSYVSLGGIADEKRWFNVSVDALINENNFVLMPVKSKIDFKDSIFRCSSIDNKLLLLYCLYGEDRRAEFRFSFSKKVTVPAGFSGRLSDIIFEDNARLVWIDNPSTLFSANCFLTLRDRAAKQNYEYLNADLFARQWNNPSVGVQFVNQKWAFEPFKVDWTASRIDNNAAQNVPQELIFYFLN